ncbi:MAG: repeat-containing protein [Chthonomonadaceae bacterium]|nr:repeat-containing protein [Chthonomonadaceae bacterium]
MNDLDYGSRFFYTGGALPPEAPSYIPRAADDQLFERLLNGDYCYVLVSRQMGKSSLMVHTLTRLVQQNITAVMVDLNSIGDDTTQEQWYYSLTEQLAAQLGLNEETDAFWDRSESKTALQKWVGALEQLLRLHSDRSLVIFIDEIDQVRSLPFTTDEFFAAIRSFHNRRAMDPNFRRLTFCLIGVALPSDLIEDPRITPFNIAERIDLTDFTEDQVVAWKVGLQRDEIQDEVLLRRVFYWTNGHPYLTQRLCRAIVEDVSVQAVQDVDRLCGRLFFGADGTNPDDNINIVSARLLHCDPDVAGLLTLYQRIAQGKSVRYDRANRLINVLILAGSIRSVSGILQVRNRIYAYVFDAKWISNHMPGVELRLQRQAYWRGVLRTLLITSIVIGVMGFLLYRAYRAEVRATSSEQKSVHALEIAKRELYVANMSLAQKAYGEHNIQRVEELLKECQQQRGMADYCGFEWRYAWGLIHQEHCTLADEASRVMSTGFSPDGTVVVTVDGDANIKRWNAETGHILNTFSSHHGIVSASSITADAGIVGIATLDKRVRIHSGTSDRIICELPGFTEGVCTMTFSRDGRLLALGTFAGTVVIWRITDKVRLGTFPSTGVWCEALAFSPDGKSLFASHRDGSKWIRDINTGRILTELDRGSGRILAASFSPDGRTLATGGYDGQVLLWNSLSGKTIRKMRGHHLRATALAFAPDGQILASASWDRSAILWNLASGERLRSLEGHRDGITCLAFSPNGHRFATGSHDRTTKIWDLDVKHTHHLATDSGLISVFFTPDGTTAGVVREDRDVAVYDVATGRLLQKFARKASTLAFGPDGRILVIAGIDGSVTANDLSNGSHKVLYNANKTVWGLDLSPTVPEAVIGNDAGLVTCVDIRTRSTRGITTPLADVASVTFSPDGRLLAILDKYGAGLVVNYLSGRTVLNFSRHGVSCCTLCFSQKSTELAVGFSDGFVEMWNTTSAKREWSALGHVGPINALAFSADGNNLVSGSDDYMVRLWNVRLGREVWTLEGHSNGICGLNFSLDSRSFISIDKRGTVIEWRGPPQLMNAGPTP